jgi:hypothetical protein
VTEKRRATARFKGGGGGGVRPHAKHRRRLPPCARSRPAHAAAHVALVSVCEMDLQDDHGFENKSASFGPFVLYISPIGDASQQCCVHSAIIDWATLATRSLDFRRHLRSPLALKITRVESRSVFDDTNGTPPVSRQGASQRHHASEETDARGRAFYAPRALVPKDDHIPARALALARHGAGLAGRAILAHRRGGWTLACGR